ncbi:hypothetical protein C823_006172 [Eubacterium plexicaudatum ASF492]|uniref:Uncharacterized protein n=1 Tax=Eubacterium plexicaudatum ASF492 TaxID=1235802 RepID=N2AHF8_9FIRM|nr:hypothetical protein C823_006172 [Eubacterium plexicaudatum ASF492]
MTENKTKQYTDNQYNRTPDHELGSGFSNYDRLMVELNNRQYYPKELYENFLNENSLDAYETFDKNTDHAKLLETVYSILQTLLSNIDMYRKVETEFVTSGEAATSLRNRLKDLRSEINRIKAEMHYADSDFTFMYYTR